MLAQHRHTTSHLIHQRANKILPAWWEKCIHILPSQEACYHPGSCGSVWLSIIPCTERSLVQFLIRAQACIACWIPSDGEMGRGKVQKAADQCLLLIFLSFPLSQINKKYKIRKKHTIYSLSIQFLFSGFIPAYLKTFLFTIFALTELSLLVLNNQIIGTGQDWKRRMCDLSISETYHRRCFSQQPLLYFSKFCSAKIGLKVVLWYDK